MTPDDIKALRRELGCGISQLAKALGVEVKDVVAWESGDRFPTKRSVDKMQALQAKGDLGLGPKSPVTSDGVARLADPEFWKLVRKLVAHPELFEATVRAAERYHDPEEPKK